MFRITVALIVILAASAARADDEPAADPARTEDASASPAADKGTVGVGIILGEPTGVSAKLYLTDDQAIQAAAGYAFISGGLHLHADYVLHPAILQSRDSFVLLAYVGPGVRLIQYRGSAENEFVAIGVRGVGGLLFDFKDQPLDAFVEVAGVLEFGFEGEGADVALNAAAGVRYYF